MRKENGQFEKGNAGRPKGSRNKTTKQLREFVSKFLAEKQEDVLSAFDELKPNEKVKLYSDLLQYGLPKLKQIEYQSILDDLSENDLDKIIKQLERKDYE